MDKTSEWCCEGAGGWKRRGKGRTERGWTMKNYVGQQDSCVLLDMKLPDGWTDRRTKRTNGRFFFNGDGPDGLLLRLSLSLSLVPVLRVLEEKSGVMSTRERIIASLPSSPPLYPWSTIKTLSRAYSQGREELLSLSLKPNRLARKTISQKWRDERVRADRASPFLT